MAIAERTLLLVDDEPFILTALTRLFREEGVRVLTAPGGAEGLALLETNDVGVIVSDQRMPQMSGVEFLSRVRERYSDTVRIILSGYTDLEYISDAINRGAIYRFLTKPWDDALLKANVEEAFRHHELKRENAHLTEALKAANAELDHINRNLEMRVEQKTREVTLNLRVLRLSQEVLENLPVAVLGIGDDGLIAVANRLAHEWLDRAQGSLIAQPAADVLPATLRARSQDSGATDETVVLGARRIEMHRHRLGQTSSAHGEILVLSPVQRDA